MNKAWIAAPLLVLTIAGCGKEAEPEGKSAAAAPVAVKPASFEAMDADKDGKVTSAEHGKGAQTLFQKLDADADGSVTVAEMDTARRDVGWFDNVASEKKIAVIDGDGDGTLTLAEFVAGANAMFTQMDTSKDSAVDDKEWSSGHAEVVPRPEALKVEK